jgi:uncharacterized protein YbjT (DUF2867 family)
VVEETFSRSELPWAPIRPLVLATNDLNWDTDQPVKLIRPAARTAPIHEHDIAAVAVAALTGSAETSGMLTGAELLSQEEVLGRAPLTYRQWVTDHREDFA